MAKKDEATTRKHPVGRDLSRILQDDPRLNGVDGRCVYIGARIPLAAVDVLPQPQQTFEQIEELAEDIASKNLLNPPVVAEFGRSACQKYLNVINALWKTNFQISDLTKTTHEGKKRWFILLAGERRFRACQYLWQNGCENCQARFDKEPEGRCFRRHFGSAKIDVRLCQDITPISALFLQFSENTHMRVPPHQEAQAYMQLFSLLRQVDEKYPLARFARNVGRSPEAIRNALRFCELPIRIQRMVEKGMIIYGIAVEIARLSEQDDQKDHELDWWATRAITGRCKVGDFRSLINQHLLERRSGQRSLMAMMEEAQRADLRRSHIKRAVESQTLNALHGFCAYFAKISRLYQEGKIGQADSPFSTASVANIFSRLLETQTRLIPILLESLPKKEAERILAMISKLRATTSIEG